MNNTVFKEEIGRLWTFHRSGLDSPALSVRIMLGMKYDDRKPMFSVEVPADTVKYGNCSAPKRAQCARSAMTPARPFVAVARRTPAFVASVAGLYYTKWRNAHLLWTLHSEPRHALRVPGEGNPAVP